MVGVYRRKRDDERIGEVRVEEGKKGEVGEVESER